MLFIKDIGLLSMFEYSFFYFPVPFPTQPPTTPSTPPPPPTIPPAKEGKCYLCEFIVILKC